MVFLKNKLRKGSVGRVVLAVSSVATIWFYGSMLYDSKTELNAFQAQLGETQTVLEQKQSDYKLLEQKFLSVQSESQKLSKENEGIKAQLDKMVKENKSLEKENDSLKKTKADTHATSSSVSAGYKDWKKVRVQASAYTANCSGCSGITTTGINLNKNPNQKVIAVDPSIIPLGSKVYVEGYGYAIAGDTGGAIRGHKIDVYVRSYQEAINFGRKQIQIYVKP